MKYISKAKSEAVGADEYSSDVKRIEDASLDLFLAEGWAECSRGEWEVVQSEEIKAAIANGEWSDEVAEVLEEPVVEPIEEVVAEEVAAE